MRKHTALITLTSVVVTAVMVSAITGSKMSMFRPGPMFDGHQRFADGCFACHEKWSGVDDRKCLSCHENFIGVDTHGAARMVNPVRAVVPERLASASCVTCHREHRSIEAKSGYTGPPGLCAMCHPKRRLNEGHAGFDPESCSTPSCHRYHFNIGADDFARADKRVILPRSKVVEAPSGGEHVGIVSAGVNKMRRTVFYKSNPVIMAQYQISPHYGTQATCDRCHKGKIRTSAQRAAINKRPGARVCMECHPVQTRGYGSGRHGAHDLQGLEPFTDPGQQVGCGGCHDVHSLGMQEARRRACERCHARSAHVANYSKSGHYRYLSDPVFSYKPMTGVDCAGCHMPRLERNGSATEHNESWLVSTRERMAVYVCVRCHGLAFSLQSLYDPKVVRSNFTIAPTTEPPGLAYAFREYSPGSRKQDR